MEKSKELQPKQAQELLKTLQERFEKNSQPHEGIEWVKVQAKLQTQPEKLWSLNEMEQTGGEPDVVGFDATTSEFIFYDCAAETPADRRSLCFDQPALDSRKANKPAGSAMGLAEVMGITLLSEAQYRELQQLGEFDIKTSSWVATPESIRELGGALFCDRRYDTVFTYHNGAESYYGARGFRGILKV